MEIFPSLETPEDIITLNWNLLYLNVTCKFYHFVYCSVLAIWRSFHLWRRFFLNWQVLCSAIAFFLSQFVSFRLLWLTVCTFACLKPWSNFAIQWTDACGIPVFNSIWYQDGYQGHSPDSKSGFQQC